MSENFLSIFLTVTFIALIGYQVFRSRRKRAMLQYNRTKNGKNTGTFGKQNPEDVMDILRTQLEQLKSLAQDQQGADHEPQTHVVQILSAIYTKLTELDKRITVFERQAEEYMKLPKGWQNP